MPQMFHLALHATVRSGHCCSALGLGSGVQPGTFACSFSPATGTSCSEFKLLVSMQLQQHFGQMLLHLLFVPMLDLPLFW